MTHTVTRLSPLMIATLFALPFVASAAYFLMLLNFKAAVIIFGVIAMCGAFFLSGNHRLVALWGLIITAPFELKKSFALVPHMGGAAAISLDAVDVFIILLTGFILRDFKHGYRTHWRVPGLLLCWFGLIILGCLDIFLGPMRFVAFLEVVRMLKLALLFLVLTNELQRVRQFQNVIAALLFSISIQCIAALLQYTFNINLGAQILGEVTQEAAEYTSLATYYDSSEFTYRVGGLIGHPNLLAIFLAMIVPIALSILFSNIGRMYKFCAAIIGSIGMVVIVLTLSRSGWLSFAVAFILIMTASFIHPVLKKRYIFSKIIVIVSIVILAFAMSGFIIKRLTESDDGAVSFRWEFIGVASKMILEKPVFGFGLNSFVWHMPEYTEYKNYQGVIERFGTDLPVVHNIYFIYWTEQGTIGLILYLMFYFSLVRMAWRGIRTYTEPFLATVNIGCLGGLMALAVDGMASFFIRNGNCGRVFFIVAAITVAINYWHQDYKRVIQYRRAANKIEDRYVLKSS